MVLCRSAAVGRQERNVWVIAWFSVIAGNKRGVVNCGVTKSHNEHLMGSR